MYIRKMCEAFWFSQWHKRGHTGTQWVGLQVLNLQQRAQQITQDVHTDSPGFAQFWDAQISGSYHSFFTTTNPPIPKFTFQLPKYTNCEYLRQMQIPLPVFSGHKLLPTDGHLLCDQSCHFCKSVSDNSLHICNQFMYRQQSKDLCLTSCLSVMKPSNFTKMDNWKWTLANRNKSAAKKQKKWYHWKWNLNQMSMNIESVADCGNVDTAAVWKTAARGNLVKTNWSTQITKAVETKRIKMPQRNWCRQKQLHIQETLGYISDYNNSPRHRKAVPSVLSVIHPKKPALFQLFLTSI